MRQTLWISLLVSWALAVPAFAAPPVTLESLLTEMFDRGRLAKWPDPEYTLGQASSTDSASVSPADPETWFSHNDWSQYIRIEERAGRKERVMLDVHGPGAIVRFWMAGPTPPGKLRIYLDGRDEPLLTMAPYDLVGGERLVGSPLSSVQARGQNLYLPIPYSKHCKITYDGPSYWETRQQADRMWYCINYRIYAAATEVRSLTLPMDRKVLDQAARKFVDRPTTGGFRHLGYGSADGAVQAGKSYYSGETGGKLEPSSSRSMETTGPASIEFLTVSLHADNLETAMRDMWLGFDFDGLRTVHCPLADFFASGRGVYLWKTWNREVGRDGNMACCWVMPFEKSCKLEVENRGKATAHVELKAKFCPWKWDDRSMHFHAAWHEQAKIKTRPLSDWPFANITGRGVYVGDTLTVHNPSPLWWGRGDEKIWIDGGKRPALFGTGTEDYYGFAYGEPKVFSAPFHAQPRVDGPQNSGATTVTRERSLDAIPFQRSLRFDLEVFHKAETEVDYAATTYWYQRP